MQRVVLAAIFVLAIVALGVILIRGAARIFESAGSRVPDTSGETMMQRVAFFLLLALMAYAITTGGT